jgi:hypothetical protein
MKNQKPQKRRVNDRVPVSAKSKNVEERELLARFKGLPIAESATIIHLIRGFMRLYDESGGLLPMPPYVVSVEKPKGQKK